MLVFGVTCSPRDPRFAGSKTAVVYEFFFQDVEILREGLYAVGPKSEISGSLKKLKPEKNRPLSKI